MYILVALCFKNLLRLEAGYPAQFGGHLPPQRLEIIPPGFGLVPRGLSETDFFFFFLIIIRNL